MNTSNSKPPVPSPGWYELPHDPEVERYWDGVQWTENVRVKKSSISFQNSSPFINPFLWKWYGLALATILVATFAIFGINFSSENSASSELKNSQSIQSACTEILNFDWYVLNTRLFETAGDVSARKSNVLSLEKYLESADEYADIDKSFINRVTALYARLDDVAKAGRWEEAASAAAEADAEFNSLTQQCADYGVNVQSPVISEATENNSPIDEASKGKIPSGYQDDGEGVAYLTAPAEDCGPGQYGCTVLEVFVYKNCPHGVKIYGNLYDANGAEVARTDVLSDPLMAGQSARVFLSTGLSTAVTANPNSFICE